MNFKTVCIITLSLVVLAAAQEVEVEDVDNILRKFNDDHVSDMKDEYSRILIEGRQDELIVKLGILATYFRIFKKLVPISQEDLGIEYLYQKDAVSFDTKIAESCTESLETCIDSILQQINETQSWIGTDTMLLDESRMKSIINNQRLSMEVSASQMLCYLTNARIKVFEHLPYCSYKLNKALTFFGKSFFAEKFIDEFVGDPYQCATESFCPDPCCKELPDIIRKSKTMKNKCSMNNCKDPETCIVKGEENAYLYNLRLNKFNITCGCEDRAQIYRSDIGECVNHNQCNTKSLCREPNKECLNVASGYKCVCQLGFQMVNEKCVPIVLSNLTDFHGFSYSEPLTKQTQEKLYFLPVMLIFLIFF